MSVTVRYGDHTAALGVANDVLAVQLAHRSVRSFLPREIGDDRLTAIVAAAQSAPTSSNLQAWSVVAVRDPGRKARLAALAGGRGLPPGRGRHRHRRRRPLPRLTSRGAAAIGRRPRSEKEGSPCEAHRRLEPGRVGNWRGCPSWW
jgi:nitroreductase